MIKIVCNNTDFEYDIKAMVMAFYPYENPEYHIVTEDSFDAGEDTVIRINMQPESINISVYNDKKCESDSQTVENSTKKKYRDDLKRLLYDVLVRFIKVKLRWGTLTGVRPTKLPMKQLLAGSDYETTVEYMKNEYFCTDEKARLSTTIAEKEIEILDREGFGDGYSIYIGIPFCPTVCTYCSFSSIGLNMIKNPDELMDNYIDALEKECRYVSTVYPDRKLTSIYVGGGTPTALSVSHMQRLMDIINECFPVGEVSEFCVEAGRPDSINEEMLMVLKNGGVNRISVNPQTMKQETLNSIGRAHTVEQTKEAFLLARKCGFDNINMDLIAGLYGETTEDFAYTLSELDTLAPDSFTVHSLVVKRASQYRQQKEAFTEEYDNENVTEAMLDMAFEYAKKHDFMPYYMYRQKNKAGLGDGHVLENVGYSKAGKESVYNIMIMEERQTILAIGAGAQSKFVKPYNAYKEDMDGLSRNANVKNVYGYIERIDEMIERKKRWLSECDDK